MRKAKKIQNRLKNRSSQQAATQSQGESDVSKGDEDQTMPNPVEGMIVNHI